MDAVILVPRRPEPWRDRLWRYVEDRVREELGLPIQVGLSTEGLFNRSRAINEAALAAGDWDVALILDADTVPEFDQAREAIARAAAGERLVMAHTLFRSLSPKWTRRVLAGKCEPRDGGIRWDLENTYSSCLAIGRGLWEKVGGFDERFEGWGYEDVAFFMACEALGGGVDRIDGPAHHLWHPRSAEKDPEDGQYQANRKLSKRYRAARSDPDAMAELLDESVDAAVGR